MSSAWVVVRAAAVGEARPDAAPPQNAAGGGRGADAARGRGGAGAGRGGRAGRGQDPLAQLPPDKRAQYDRRMAEIEKQYPLATVKDFVDHIDHAVKLIGIDHVGISSDFDGGGGVIGWDNAAESFNVTLELVRRGYTEEQIAKLWGGNLLRVWREVECRGRAAAEGARGLMHAGDDA